MVESTSALHVYDREIDSSERTSLSVLASHIPAGARVLDLGCGSGAIGRFLSARDGAATIDGLTINEDEAQRAAAHYRRVEVADLDRCVLTDLFEPASYDIIVCADVLEHVRQSDRVLSDCRSLLASGGQVLLSIPNAAYCGLIAELMAGEFRYRSEGLLDETHVRFFTRQTLLRFLDAGGWAVRHIETIVRQLPASEFRIAFDALPPAVARHLLALPDALTYQFIVIAQPLADAASDLACAHAIDAATPLLPVQALFTAQLYVRTDAEDGYAESDKITALGVVGQERQVLRFALHEAAPASLRLDPADRPGFVHLYAMRLQSASGETLWNWDAGQADVLLNAAQQDIVLQPPSLVSGGFLLLLHGDDPWVELPVPRAALEQAGRGSFEVDMGWPMSADYLALAGAAQRLQSRRDENARLGEQLKAAQQELQLAREQHDTALKQNEQLRERNQALQIDTHALSRERDEAMQLVHAIENSTVFRATRPLVHAKMRVDRLLGVGSARPPQARPVPTPRPLTPAEHPVDLIVPVYRGLEDTQRCIQSVMASTCRTPWRLVIINDASPEPAVTQWLRELVAQADDPRLLLLENDENLGFVGTVNRGMALSADNDVLLLNSDTEVAGDWLDRIRAAAYGDQKVASVTPFSNNATICSYPRFCRDNDLPEGWTTADLDALCARTNPGQVVDVPTGVGFCMYIRRAALAEVGLFDVENFGKGYGEENDFCVRAAQAGWRNLHALDTFVRHFGGVSFGDSKSPRERAAMETMRRLHPRYEAEVIAFVRQDPAAPARAALDFARAAARGRPLILAVMHDRQGGTLQHVHDLARLLASQAGFLVLRPVPGGKVGLQLAEAGSDSELRFALPDEFDALLDTLRALGVRHIHFHHLLGHLPLIRDTLARRLGVTHDFTAHDFYPVCPQISMIGVQGSYCGEEGLAQCHACLRRQPAPDNVGIEAWRAEHADLLLHARHVIAPSRDVLQRLAHYLPTARYSLVPHMEPGSQHGWPPPAPRPRAPDAPLRIAIIGALSAIKGADVLEDTALAAQRSGAPVEFHLIGYGYRALHTQPRARLTVHGRYDDADLPALLDWLQPDLVWFPAQVPESYSYTLSAALRAGLPVVAPNLGAFAERLNGRAWTWVEPWSRSADEWLAFFQQLRQQHFIPGTPPQRALAVRAINPGSDSLPAPAQDATDWYRGPYLDGLLPAQATAPLPRELIERHLVATQVLSAPRGAVLGLLARLRALPALAPVARAIPPRWQARVKDWLQR